MRLVRRVRARLAAQRGFATVTVMGVLSVGVILVAAGFVAADGDIALSREDQDRKQALAAAEAGIAYYLFQLGRDNSYWTRCTSVAPPSATEPSPVNQRWDGTGADPRTWRRIPGAASSYTIELLPAPGFGQCTTSAPDQSMLDPATGTFRIRATGRSRGERRSLVATFRRRSFLDYLYFTDYETSDPATYPTAEQAAWASANCRRYHRQSRSGACTPIQFADADAIRGPLHTNDDLLVCGAPDFGRTRADAIEVSAPNPGWRASCGGSRPNFVGSWGTAAPLLTMPPSNAALRNVADPAYRFTGRTTIVLAGATMTVTNPAWAGERVVVPPVNGVIYVSTSSCPAGYTIEQGYTSEAGCGDVWVRGRYADDLTIAADNDVVIDGDLRRDGDPVLGLIANNFIRVYHPVRDRNEGRCTNETGSMPDVRIDAALLALQHSFIVDNYYCGAALNHLAVNGAIAQRHRGPVGTGGASIVTGYIKRYEYDDRLRYRDPPYFLDPVQSAWRVMRQTEQVPAR